MRGAVTNMMLMKVLMESDNGIKYAMEVKRLSDIYIVD